MNHLVIINVNRFIEVSFNYEVKIIKHSYITKKKTVKVFTHAKL